MMTQGRPIRVLDDGTRVYSNGGRYTPVPLDQRVNKIHKPDDPGAVRFGNEWFLPLDVLPDDIRLMPETRPDTDAYDHMEKPRKCLCPPCQRDTARAWQERWLKDHNFTPVKRRRRRRR